MDPSFTSFCMVLNAWGPFPLFLPAMVLYRSCFTGRIISWPAFFRCLSPANNYIVFISFFNKTAVCIFGRLSVLADRFTGSPALRMSYRLKVFQDHPIKCQKVILTRFDTDKNAPGITLLTSPPGARGIKTDDVISSMTSWHLRVMLRPRN